MYDNHNERSILDTHLITLIIEMYCKLLFKYNYFVNRKMKRWNRKTMKMRLNSSTFTDFLCVYFVIVVLIMYSDCGRLEMVDASELRMREQRLKINTLWLFIEMNNVIREVRILYIEDRLLYNLTRGVPLYAEVDFVPSNWFWMLCSIRLCTLFSCQIN